MPPLPTPSPLQNAAELTALYPEVKPVARSKVVSQLGPRHRRFIELAPLAILATQGHQMLDCTPRGDPTGAVAVIDESTLALPDWPGNNRLDALKALLGDDRVALWFVVPGSATSMKVKGRAIVTADPAWREHLSVEGKQPRTVTVIKIEQAYMHCGRALLRSGLWDTKTWPEPSEIPSQGQMLAEATQGEHGGTDYDRQWPERAKASLY